MATPRTESKLTTTIRTRVTTAEYEALERLADQDFSNVSLIVRRFIRRQLAAAETIERGNVAV